MATERAAATCAAEGLQGRRPRRVLPTIRGMAQWRCRLCGFERYHRVAVLKKNGQRYETSFLACSGCSVMFLNDATFNALHLAMSTLHRLS